ncbi:MAG: PEP-CTERM sorting domain-containing protein [Phycisphaerae bacterium]|nr:PEP-CTERM sorting domain-containing protein [Phycisphaerae bacterium]
MKTFATILAVAALCVAGTAQAATFNSVEDGDWTDDIWDTTGDTTPDGVSPNYADNNGDQGRIGDSVTVTTDTVDGKQVGVGNLYNDGGTLTMTGGSLVTKSFESGSSDWSATNYVQTGGDLRLHFKYGGYPWKVTRFGTALRFDGGTVSANKREDSTGYGWIKSTDASDWLFASGSTLEVDISGTGSLEYDHMKNESTDAASALELADGSSINMNAVGGYSPELGDTVTVMTWNEITLAAGVNVSDGWTATVIDDGAGDLDTLQMEYVPEPATMALLGFGGIGLLVRRRRRA